MLVEDRRGKILVVLIAVVEREAYKIPGGEFRERFGQVFKIAVSRNSGVIERWLFGSKS
jgi:hypothetical protein